MLSFSSTLHHALVYVFRRKSHATGTEVVDHALETHTALAAKAGASDAIQEEDEEEGGPSQQTSQAPTSPRAMTSSVRIVTS